MAKKGTKKAATTAKEEIKQENPVIAGAVDVDEVKKSIESIDTEIKVPDMPVEEKKIEDPLAGVKEEMNEVEKEMAKIGEDFSNEAISKEEKVENIQKTIEKIDELSKKTNEIIKETTKKQKQISKKINITSWWNGSGYDF